ncbi:MBL fold metallo-hydrolase [Sporomusa termitida]|uniref:Metallo-beta-lactamase superfamily protein n=1 Tax=Sporomusa termitida TaxID=2377 RepID=A0A517DUZ8_9FIRM|nr:MBL fold metallo-hydrolase [Sporomusa termitida]QDR81182.1 Metallo-beta-lactamase superfamily protein [Sporomusa termitida]
MSKVTPLKFGISNLTLIQDQGIIIVDTGCQSEKEAYVQAFAELGIQPADISLIVITHAHWDHCSRVNELKDLTGAPVLCHKHAVPVLQKGEMLPFIPRGEEGKRFVEMIANDDADVLKPINPDIIIDSDFDLTPFGVTGKIIHTPGHSDCSVSVVLDSGETITGDILRESPFTGDLNLAFIATDEAKLIDSVRNLLAIKNIHSFYGGHGGPYTREAVSKLVK